MNQKKLIKKILSKKFPIAVVGASNNPEKYGYRVYKDLKSAGFVVYPVNLEEEKIQGDRAYKSVKDLPKKVAVVNMVIPPDAAKSVIDQAAETGVTSIWFQPGSERHDVVSFAQSLGLSTVQNSCIMIERRKGAK